MCVKLNVLVCTLFTEKSYILKFDFLLNRTVPKVVATSIKIRPPNYEIFTDK